MWKFVGSLCKRKRKQTKNNNNKKGKSTSNLKFTTKYKQTPSPKAAWCLFVLAQNAWDISSTQQTSCTVLSCNLHTPVHWQNSPKCSCAVNSPIEPQDHAGILKDMHMVGELHSEERHTLWALQQGQLRVSQCKSGRKLPLASPHALQVLH